jgi:hypothetical protein
VTIDCTNTELLWDSVPRFPLSKKALVNIRPDEKVSPVIDARNPVAALVLISDPTKSVAGLPVAIQSKLDSFHGEYAFQWNEKRLYGYIKIQEQQWDSGHPLVSEKTFKSSPSDVTSSDLFYSSSS